MITDAAVIILQVPAFTFLPSGPARTVRWLARRVGPGRSHGPGRALATRAGRRSAGRHRRVPHRHRPARARRPDPADRRRVHPAGSADAFVHGDNPYTQVWVGPPGVMQAFTYLPRMAVLLAPASSWSGQTADGGRRLVANVVAGVGQGAGHLGQVLTVRRLVLWNQSSRWLAWG